MQFQYITNSIEISAEEEEHDGIVDRYVTRRSILPEQKEHGLGHLLENSKESQTLLIHEIAKVLA